MRAVAVTAVAAVLVAAAVLAVRALAGPGEAPLRGITVHTLWSGVDDAEMRRQVDLAADAGATVIRTDVGWSNLQPARAGAFDPGYVRRIDALFAAAAERDLRVLVSLQSTPCWASSAPEELRQGCAGPWWERGVQSHPPADPATFGAAARWLLDRHGDRMAALEVWNEPNLPPAELPGQSGPFWTADDEAAAYARLLRAAYPAAKAGDPDVPVLAGALARADAPFLEQLYANGIGGHHDGIAVHPYNEDRATADPGQGRDVRDQTLRGLDAIRAVQRRHGDDSRVWVTEFGWSTCAPGTSSWCVDPERQARFVEDAWRHLAARDDVAAAVLYNLVDAGPGESLTERFGVVGRDGRPKPAYAALRRALGGDG